MFKKRKNLRHAKNRGKQHKFPDVKSSAYDHAILSWAAPEYVYHEKSIWWFIAAGAVAVLLVIWGLISQGWTFSLAIIVFSGTYYLLHRQKPKVVEVKVSRFGVKIGNHVFPYGRIKGFWIVYDPPYVNNLYLRISARLHPDVFVNISNVDPAELRKTLSEHLEEIKDKHEPVADSLVRLLRL